MLQAFAEVTQNARKSRAYPYNYLLTIIFQLFHTSCLLRSSFYFDALVRFAWVDGCPLSVAYLRGATVRRPLPLWLDHENFLQATSYQKVRFCHFPARTAKFNNVWWSSFIPIQYATKISMWDCIWYDAPSPPTVRRCDGEWYHFFYNFCCFRCVTYCVSPLTSV